jgi:hypothetical protein
VNIEAEKQVSSEAERHTVCPGQWLAVYVTSVGFAYF